jgi:hypothetical protein
MDNIPQVTGYENDPVKTPFMEREVKQTVFQMEHNKFSDPYGFPVQFF